MKIYLDTSAVLALFIPDIHSNAVQGWIDQASGVLCTSRWVKAEILDGLGRFERSGLLSVEAADVQRAAIRSWLEEECINVSIDDAVLETAMGFLQKPSIGLCGMDAVHVALALRAGASLVTCDAGLVRSCQTIGLASLLILGSSH
jgi:uncharacterized protein